MNPLPPNSIDLNGVIDLHIHSAPDVRPRKLDDVELARQAQAAGMKAILIKSHHTCTADRATIANKFVEGTRVVGALALNHAVGGLNPAAVETALSLGAREIWMPTISAAHWINAHAGINPKYPTQVGQQGIRILNDAGKLFPVVHEILELVAAADVILGTGHLSIPETRKLVPAARAAGVRRILVTHPELTHIEIPIPIQEELRDQGAFFERCYLNLLPGHICYTAADLARMIRAVGVESTALSTDLGQTDTPFPVDGFRQYIAALLAEGITPVEIDRMVRQNPAWLLGMD